MDSNIERTGNDKPLFVKAKNVEQYNKQQNLK